MSDEYASVYCRRCRRTIRKVMAREIVVRGKKRYECGSWLSRSCTPRAVVPTAPKTDKPTPKRTGI